MSPNLASMSVVDMSAEKNDKTRRGMEGRKEGWELVEFSLIWFQVILPKVHHSRERPLEA